MALDIPKKTPSYDFFFLLGRSLLGSFLGICNLLLIQCSEGFWTLTLCMYFLLNSKYGLKRCDHLGNLYRLDPPIFTESYPRLTPEHWSIWDIQIQLGNILQQDRWVWDTSSSLSPQLPFFGWVTVCFKKLM